MSNILKLLQTQLSKFFSISSTNELDMSARTLSLSNASAAEVINQSDEVNSGYMSVSNDTQTITPSISGYITAVGIYTNQLVAMAGPMRISVFGFSPIASFTIPLGAQWVKGVLSTPVYLKKGVTYTLSFSPNNGGDFARMGYDATGSYSGGSMGSNPALDFMFRVYMTATSAVDFPTGSITAVTQDIANNLATTIVPSSQQTKDYVTTYVSNNLPITTVALPNSGSDAWYGMGYINVADLSYGVSEATFEVTTVNTTSFETSRSSLTLGWNASSIVAQKYNIISGNISSIRPPFRIYTNVSNTILYAYVKIPNGNVTTLNIDRYLNYPTYLSTFGFYYDGTGANPNSSTGLTLKYDTVTNNAGIISPKNVVFSGPFAGGAQTIPIYFSVNGDQCTMHLSQLVVTGFGTGAITAPAGTIPTTLMPYGYSISNLPSYIILVDDAGTISTGRLTINTSLDGGFTIYRNVVGANFTGTPVGFYNQPVTWVIKNA